MFRKAFLFTLALSLTSFSTLPAAGQAKLTAAQVVEKNIAARGGAQAWKGVQTMSWSGKMDAGAGDSIERSRRFAQNQGHLSNSRMAHGDMAAGDKASKQVQLSFKHEMKRPNKSRTEIEFAGKTAVQVFDGSSGWKYRPFLNRNDVEPFSPDEAKMESEDPGIGGYLTDYSARGSKVDLDGMEKVEGHDAYKLKVTSKTGGVKYVWVDAQSFLDVKVSGNQKHMDGKMHNVYIYQRDFRDVQGVKVPFVMETAVEGYRETHKAILETVLINPKLDDSRFTKPQAK